MLEPGYGYIRISTFQADTAADFQKTLDKLQAQAGGKLRGLVLDLRSNPGGLLTAAVQVADDLLDKGNIVSTRGPHLDQRRDASTPRPGDLLDGAPVVVLVDAGSASASEVLAGALRDNSRARVVGSRTFGKGSVQTVLPLDNGDSVKLTTARYFTPSGKSIQASGIVPDVVLQPDRQPGDDDLPASLADYSEATLPGHLRGDEEGDDGYKRRRRARRRRADHRGAGGTQEAWPRAAAQVDEAAAHAGAEAKLIAKRGLRRQRERRHHRSPVAASRIADWPLRSTSSMRTIALHRQVQHAGVAELVAQAFLGRVDDHAVV